MPLIFLRDNERLTVKTYMKYLKKQVFPWARATYGDQWWWQQDGASCHTAKAMQHYLAAKMLYFFRKEKWPPHSPDLSPLDFAIFGRLKGELSGVQYCTKEQLKSAIITVCNNLNQNFIESCRKFRSRLEQVFNAHGGYIK